MTPKDLISYWLVPSSSGKDQYVVTTLVRPAYGGIGNVRVPVACTCKDFHHRVHDCKHMQRVAKSVDGLKKHVAPLKLAGSWRGDANGRNE